MLATPRYSVPVPTKQRWAGTVGGGSAVSLGRGPRGPTLLRGRATHRCCRAARHSLGGRHRRWCRWPRSGGRSPRSGRGCSGKLQGGTRELGLSPKPGARGRVSGPGSRPGAPLWVALGSPFPRGQAQWRGPPHRAAPLSTCVAGPLAADLAPRTLAPLHAALVHAGPAIAWLQVLVAALVKALLWGVWGAQ